MQDVKMMVISLEAGEKLLAMQKNVHEITKAGMTSRQRKEAQADIDYLESQVQKFNAYRDGSYYNDAMEEIDNGDY